MEFKGFEFTGSANIQSNNSVFELLKEGIYKAMIKDVALSETSNGAAKLIVYFELEDSKKVIKSDFILPVQGCKEFIIEMIKNLFSRVQYSNLTIYEFKQISEDEVNKKLSNIKEFKSFIGKRVTVEIEQSPFIAGKKETNEVTNIEQYVNQFLDLQCSKILPNATKKIQNMLASKDFQCFPKLLFSNKVKPKSIGFYNDFQENKLKDSPSKIWYDKLINELKKEDNEYNNQQSEEF